MPAKTWFAFAARKALTSSRPRPRAAPVPSTFFPSISIGVRTRYFGHGLQSLCSIRAYSREPIQDRADETPDCNQLDACQRMFSYALTERGRTQHCKVLEQLNKY